MTFWTHVLINNFTGKNAHQDSNPPLNAAGYIRKWICIHSHERLHQEPIAKRQWGDAGVQLHTMLGQIRYNFRFGVCSPDPRGTTHISACDPWSRDRVTLCTPSPSRRSRSPISELIVDLHLLHEEQTLVGPAQDCCPADDSQASDWLKTLAEVPTNPTRGHPPQLWVEGPRWRSGGVVALTAHWSEPEAVPIISSAFSHLYRSFHIHSLLGYPSWYYTLDVQPWKTALKVPSAHLCTSNEGSKIPQSPEISKYVKEVILRHFCCDSAQILLKTKGWVVCQNRWNSSFGEQKDFPEQFTIKKQVQKNNFKNDKFRLKKYLRSMLSRER